MDLKSVETTRRETLALAAMASLAALLAPRMVLADEAAVAAEIKKLYGDKKFDSGKIKLDAPEIAENGAVVPVSVTTALADVTSISFLVSENPVALIASYKIPAGTVPSIANRIKMAKTSNVLVVVEAGGKLYSATKEVKVTVGGCGG